MANSIPSAPPSDPTDPKQQLKGGKVVWNAWREAHPELMPDLSDLTVEPSFFDSPALDVAGRIDLSGINFRGIRATNTSLSDVDLSGVDFSGAHLQNMVFSNTPLAKANFDGAVLSHSKFWSAEAPGASFWDAELEDVVMTGAKLRDTNFTGANLARVNLEGADLTGAELWRANMESANLDGASLFKANMNQINLSKANLSRCDLKNTNLYEANLSEAALDEADVRFADLRRANLAAANVVEIQYNKQSRYRGIRVATCYGSPRFTRTANDQNYIEEFRSKRWDPFIRFRSATAGTGAQSKSLAPIPIGEWLYWIWWFSSDCGRSLWRWTVMSLLLSVLFGWGLYSLGEDAFYISTYNGHRLEWSLETMIYYSMGNFAKVTFGAISPLTPAAERWVVASGMAGLVALGGLITILADKVARRA